LSDGIEVKEVGLCNWGQWFCAHAPMLAISNVNKKNDTKCFIILYYYPKNYSLIAYMTHSIHFAAII
jgi:hypothetical protein